MVSEREWYHHGAFTYSKCNFAGSHGSEATPASAGLDRFSHLYSNLHLLTSFFPKSSSGLDAVISVNVTYEVCTTLAAQGIKHRRRAARVSAAEGDAARGQEFIGLA